MLLLRNQKMLLIHSLEGMCVYTCDAHVYMCDAHVQKYAMPTFYILQNVFYILWLKSAKFYILPREGMNVYYFLIPLFEIKKSPLLVHTEGRICC